MQGEVAAFAPLSEQQRGVWIAQRIDPGSPAYHECTLWLVDGPFDVEAFERALAAVAARQPALRTRYVHDGEAPRQEVVDAPNVDLERVALAGSGEAQRAALDAAVHERMRRPFDLAAGAPIRWTAFALGPGRHALLRVWHHVMGDGLSGPVMREDLERAYALAVAGARCELPPVGADYLAYTRWQLDPSRRAERQPHVDAWKARLQGVRTLALPTDFHGPGMRSLRGAFVSSHLAPADVEALKRVGRQAHVTTFVIALTAFAALLARMAGDDDVVVGTPIGGRPSPAYDDVVGFFASVMPCRVNLGGGLDAGAAAALVRDRVREAIRDHDAPLEAVVEALGLARDPSRHPFFRVGFALGSADNRRLALAGCEVRRLDLELGHARFDLTLTLSDGPDGIEATWHYATDLFERATVERWARAYGELCRAMVREPRAPILSLPLMDAGLRERVVAAGRGRATPLAGEEVVHRRFAAQAAARPQARAIGSVDYATLEAASNRLAQELVARGVGRGSFVAVAREKAADLAVAWLAVLKCGAAYVPLDVALPEARLASMLADAKVAHAIVDEASAYKLERKGVDRVRPEAEQARIAAHAPLAPAVEVDAEDAAYAIYTSGSTGKPKGVVVPHRAIVSLVIDNDYAPLGPEDVVAQLAPAAFDASTFEIWGPLLNGASIAPIAKAVALSPRALREAIVKEGITTLFLTTALFEAVAREAPEAFGPCRTVLFGGEACDARRVGAVLKAGPPARLVHVYGPTETTTFATWHEVREVDARAVGVPIGRAIARAEAYVLRADGEPCAPGEPGEIAIGGRGLALGYLDARDEEHRFVTAKVGDLEPRRLYRTGDRARVAEDGTISFLGRADDQVKVLGHRIELGEVEAAIARHPGVRAAACVLRGATSEERRIVAYVVPANANAAPPDDLRKMLRTTLPASMLPAEIAWVPALPLNASGKVDRRALAEVAVTPAPEPSRRSRPPTPLEQDLLARWRTLLGRDTLSVRDHFFDVGGSSLLAARMVDDYERDTGIAVPLSALFVDDTVAGLARAITEGSLATHADVAPLHAEGRRMPFVFVHGDFYSAGFHSHALARLLGPDQPIYAVHPHGIGGGGVPDTIEAMAADRLRALRELRPHGPYVVGGHCNGAFVAFEIARQLLDAGESVPALIVVDSPAPDPDGDPAVRDAALRRALVRVGYLSQSMRTADIAQRLKHAMNRYRAVRLPTHLAYVRSGDDEAGEYGDAWLALAASSELHALPGAHLTVIVGDGGVRFSAVVRAVVDRAMRQERRGPG